MTPKGGGDIRRRTRTVKRAQPSREPQVVDDIVWYYERPKSILVHAQFPGSDVISFAIPLRMLEATLRRCPQPRAPR